MLVAVALVFVLGDNLLVGLFMKWCIFFKVSHTWLIFEKLKCDKTNQIA